MDIFNSKYVVLARLAAAAVLGTGFSSSVLASPVIIQPTAAEAQDTFVYQGMASWNLDGNGFQRLIAIGKSSAGHDLNGLVKFDLSTMSLAAGETVSLNLYVQSTESAGFAAVSPTASFPAVAQVYSADKAWTANAVNWNSNIGGSNLIASQSISGTGNWVSFDVTQQVQSWLDGAANNGFFISQAAAVNTGTGYVNLVFTASGATGDAYANRPFLQVVPEPASMAGLVVIGGMLLRRRRV